MTDKVIECYSVTCAAEILGMTSDALRMRVNRGVYQVAVTDARVVGIVKRDFWRVCIKYEQNGMIVPDKMPQAYRDERQQFAGDMVYTDNVLRGRKPSRG